MGVGARLKEAREEKGLSLENLQETTKIQKRYLRAIEEENFDILPGKFYARAFIKEYALALNLDVDELFDEFKDDLPQPDDQPEVQYTRVQQTRKGSKISKNSHLFSLIPTIIVIVLILGVIFAVWFFMLPSDNEEVNQTENQNDNEIIRTPNENENNNNAAIEDGNANENEDYSDTENAENSQDLELSADEDTENGQESRFNLNNVEDELKLILNSDGETWLEIKNDENEEIFYGILDADESPLELDVIDEDEIFFSVGNASVLDIKFNDLEFDYPLDPTEHVVQNFRVNINKN